jgi:hypothetical protein
MPKFTRWSESQEDGVSYLHFWKAEPACVLIVKNEENEHSVQTCCTRFPSLTISGSSEDARLLALTQAVKEIEESRGVLEKALEELKRELSGYGLELGQKLKDLKSHK